MIDKISGKVAYAVLSFGGFLGIGEVSLGGYRVNFTRDQLDTAPKYTESQGWELVSRE
jgi:hypothetical protein